MKIELTKSGEIELLNFIDMTYDEKLQILGIRNDPRVREWMYSEQEITEVGHLNFIEKLKSDSTQKYFTIKKDGLVLGVLYFTHIDNKEMSTEFGLYSNPFERLSGKGTIIQETAITYAFDYLKVDRINLEVFSDNVRAINLYTKYGFSETRSKLVKERHVSCMTLDKNNR